MARSLFLLLFFVMLGTIHGEPDSILLKTLPDFTAEQVYAARGDEGSWSAMAIDPQGRVVVSPQGDEPMLRISVRANKGEVHVERITAPVTSAMGLLFAFGSFYVNGMGPEGFGLYRLRDTKGADAFDEVKLLRKFEGEVSKEHGSHGLAAGPDGKLYLAQGNHVSPPKDVLPSSPFKNYAEDQLLPSASYGLSSGDRAQAPCGHILRMDPDGSHAEIFAAGLRNIYDLAFDGHGELFTYDSDTEFNWGLPWYVPTRILHVVSGGDYGFREGTGKWPTDYPDTLPSVVDVGLGCPTGVKFGTKSHFPPKYQRALFGLDWTFGRIIAVHLEAHGSSFSGSFETFLQGRPLNLTALDFGKDGAMYFVTGGRKTRSALYRVKCTGHWGDSMTRGIYGELKSRRDLESFHGKADERAVTRLWASLGSKDRFLSHAARVALESQPVADWSARALSEKEPRTALTALLALARVGSQTDRATVIKQAAQWWPQLKDESLQLDVLRIAELALARHGQPYPETKAALLRVLDAAYPTKSPKLNRELSQILIALEAPRVVPRTLALVRQADTLEEQLHYIFHLRHLATGWSPEDRETYFRWFTQPHPSEAHAPDMKKWFADVHLHYADGGSLMTYLMNIREEAAQTLESSERTALASLLGTPLQPPLKPVEIKPHTFVKEWTTAELLPLVEKMTWPRSLERGRETFTAASCLACHRYANEGGAVGPDLNAVAYKLGAREMVESVIEPSKVIADQFQNTIVELTNGETRVGRILKKGKDRIALSINPFGNDREEIPRSKIRSMKPSPVSPMPPGLLNAFTEEEILDLFAYLGFGEP